MWRPSGGRQLRSLGLPNRQTPNADSPLLTPDRPQTDPTDPIRRSPRGPKPASKRRHRTGNEHVWQASLLEIENSCWTIFHAIPTSHTVFPPDLPPPQEEGHGQANTVGEGRQQEACRVPAQAHDPTQGAH